MYSLVLHLVEMDTNPDRQDPAAGPAKWCRSERIRIHNTVASIHPPVAFYCTGALKLV
jgi:hypothetical protein